MEGRRKISRNGGVIEHQSENLGGDPHVDPLDDGEIVLDPNEDQLGGERSRRRRYQGGCTGRGEVMTPMVVTVRGEI
jgi:hypothetical protein